MLDIDALAPLTLMLEYPMLFFILSIKILIGMI